ncbi:Uncharacterised protein [Arthrobacter agilis]|uniref:hypothetical protein n=1 Tax=Arthrobacter agilis TaxID=37921 RepID=UPI000F704779|nr:hypothetical protein [Arthrobacter agilis]VDR31370.1 Uncharacterised protein [Arthrobacter agilis]
MNDQSDAAYDVLTQGGRPCGEARVDAARVRSWIHSLAQELFPFASARPIGGETGAMVEPLSAPVDPHSFSQPMTALSGQPSAAALAQDSSCRGCADGYRGGQRKSPEARARVSSCVRPAESSDPCLRENSGAHPNESEEQALISQLTALEDLKSAIAAAQVRVAMALDTSRRRAEAAAGLPAEQRGRGVAAEIALARRNLPIRALGSSAWPAHS